MRSIVMLAFAVLVPVATFAAEAAPTKAAQPAAAKPVAATKTPPLPPENRTGLEFIDTSFENASPVWYEPTDDGTIAIHLLYDHERSSPNRAAGHFHFLLHAAPGSKLTLEFKNLDNVWNGRHRVGRQGTQDGGGFRRRARTGNRWRRKCRR